MTNEANDSWSDKLHLNLLREMDAAHKALVRRAQSGIDPQGGAR
jgi:hypothetical protein